jgi:hypothetical protein
VQLLALALVALRGVIPDLFSMTVSNTFVLGGTVLLCIGLEKFLEKRGSQWQNLFLLVVFVPLHVYFVIHPNLNVCNILFSLALLVIFAQMTWLLLRRVEVRLLPLTATAPGKRSRIGRQSAGSIAR